MGRHFKHTESTLVYDERNCRGHLLADAEKADLIRLSIGIGASIARHPQPVAITFYVIEGTGEILLSTGNIALVEGDAVEVPAEVERGWVNTGEVVLELLAVKHK